jgi:iron complex transport system permease protein
MKKTILIGVVILCIVITGILHLCYAGPISIWSYSETSLHNIFWNYRFPRLCCALLCGMALPLSGLVLQVLFRNPIAGPYVLGISSGASFMVALVTMGAALFWQQYTASLLVLPAAIIGSISVMLIMVLLSNQIPQNTVLILCGVLISQFLGAAEGVLGVFSRAQDLQNFWFWNMGFIPALPYSYVLLFACAVLICLICLIAWHRKIQILILGFTYAQTMGVNPLRLRLFLIIAASVLSGFATAFCGPIAFIGMSVPILSRIWFKTASIKYQLLGCAAIGSVVLLLTDLLAQRIFEPQILPLNSISSCFGVPVVFWSLLKQKSFSA